MRGRSQTLDQWLNRLETQLQLDRLMVGCCQALLEFSGADRCSIMVLDNKSEELVVRWAQGSRVKPRNLQPNLKFRVGEGLCGWVARSQKAFCTVDATKEPRFLPFREKEAARLRPVRAICCLPLVLEGRTVGVVNLSSLSSSKKFRRVQGSEVHRFLNRLGRVIGQATLLHEMEASSRRFRAMAKATSQTVAQVSHEVRTPLSLITEGTQQLLDGLVGELTPPLQERVLFIKHQADRMLQLVTELLDISRIEAGRLVPHRQPMKLDSVIEEVRRSYEPLVAPRRLTLELDPVPPVYADRMRVAQILENLLTNAVKFTPPEGSITLRLSARGSSAELAVSDTGIGISKGEQRRLFEKFFQPKTPASFAHRGTGLGLAIVKEIVQLHGGTIRVSSEPNRGTTFIVSLPLYTPAFALTEEFRVMREQAAREGVSLVFQLLRNGSIDRPEVVDLLRRHLAREDRVLVNPQGGGLAILSVCDPAGSQALRRRLEDLLASKPEWVDLKNLRWSSVLVPQESSELAGVIQMAHQR